jgi:phenylpyruvate tautomerase PptA (4-oxalocrotonate tautomerase family)
MPQVRIETRNHWLNGRHEALYDAIQAAMVEGIKIPEDDRCYRLVEYDEAHFPSVPGKSDRFIIIEIALFAGRSIAAKRNMYAAIARNLKAAFGLEASDIRIVLEENSRDNWSMDGMPASEIDLGFKVEV